MHWEVSSVVESVISATYAVSSLCDSVWEAADLKGHKCLTCDHSSGVTLKQEHVPAEVFSSLQNTVGRAVQHPKSLDVKMKAAALGLSVWNGHGTVTASRLKRGRHLKSPCPRDCSRCDNPKLTEDERSKIFDNFWSLKIHERQWMFLLASVTSVPPKKKCALPGSKREKQMSRVYHFSVNGISRRVCKTMFKNTLCISDSWINSALSHFSDSGLIPDMRGRHMRKKEKENRLASPCHFSKVNGH